MAQNKKRGIDEMVGANTKQASKFVNKKKPLSKGKLEVKPDEPSASEQLRDMLLYATEDLQDLVSGKEEKAFAENWVNSRYAEARAKAYAMWQGFATEFCEDQGILYSETQWAKDFAEMQSKLWTKYLQSGLHELAAHFKQRPILLDKEEFEELPPCALKNLDNFPLFENFLDEDMLLEVARSFKYQAMSSIQEHLLPDDRQVLKGGPEEERAFLLCHCCNEFLDKDEAEYYNSLLQQLEGKKWSSRTTDIYIQAAMKDFKELQINEAIQSLLNEEGYMKPFGQKERSSKQRQMAAEVQSQQSKKKRSKTQEHSISKPKQKQDDQKERQKKQEQPIPMARQSRIQQFFNGGQQVTYNEKREKEINKLDSCIYNGKKQIKLEHIQDALRLFGEGSDGEDDYDEEEAEDDEENYQVSEQNQEQESESEYSSSSDSTEEQWVPHAMKQFQQAYADKIEVKKNGFKFKKGFDPFRQRRLDFVVQSDISVPLNLPMLESDTGLTEASMLAAIQDPDRPISEYAKKQFFYDCYKNFETAIKAEPELICGEIQKHLRRYNQQFGLHMQGTKQEREQATKITRGEYRRFCAIFYLITRKLLMSCEQLVLQEGKKRIMPRHIMNAAISTGIIPYEIYIEQKVTQADLDFLKAEKEQRQQTLLANQAKRGK